MCNTTIFAEVAHILMTVVQLRISENIFGIRQDGQTGTVGSGNVGNRKNENTQAQKSCVHRPVLEA